MIMAKIGKTVVRLPRKYAKDEIIEVKTRIIHPNHNGRRKYRDIAYIEQYYIHRIVVFYGDLKVIDMQASSAISQNPYFTFSLKATHSAPLTVRWFDTRGEEFVQQAEVTV